MLCFKFKYVGKFYYYFIVYYLIYLVLLVFCSLKMLIIIGMMIFFILMDEFIVNVVYIGFLGKGIFVVDEFMGIIGKCFVSINVENVELNSCVLCEFLFIILGVF